MKISVSVFVQPKVLTDLKRTKELYYSQLTFSIQIQAFNILFDSFSIHKSDLYPTYSRIGMYAGSGVPRPEVVGGAFGVCKTTCLLTMPVTSCDLG